MIKRKLGNTGLSVSEIAFGGVEIGLPYGFGVESHADMLSKSSAIKLLHQALDQGINFFDTARMYGESESIMGEAFKNKRHEVILASKCTHFRDSKGRLPANSELGLFIENSINESLKALQTDYLDIFMLHQADLEILENPVIAEVFASLKKSGKIRFTGASTYSCQETNFAIASGNWDVIQLPFNLMDQQHAPCFEEARKKGIGIVVRSVLMRGFLSDRGASLHPALSQVEKHIKSYDMLLNASFPDLPTLATKFALSFDNVSAVLVGIDKVSYLEKALATANGQYMDLNFLNLAQSKAYPEPEFLNLPYWDRMGWLK
tara:strand:- start:281 stop:1237 length:957 start_codon:yes stop_codon:yes gene_type:complete